MRPDNSGADIKLIEQQFRQQEWRTNRSAGFSSLGFLAVCITTELMLKIDFSPYVHMANELVFIPACALIAAFYVIARLFRFEGGWIKYMLMSGIILMSVGFFFAFTTYASFYLTVPIVIACRYFDRRFIHGVSVVTFALFLLACYLNVALEPYSAMLREFHAISSFNSWTNLKDALVFVVAPISMVIAFVAGFSIKTSRLARGLLKSQAEFSSTMASVEAEMDTAAKLQRSVLPSPSYICPDGNFRIAAQEIPVKEVGGDFYDYFMAGKHSLAVLIADVSDKGVPAALFMMSAQKALRCAIQCSNNLTDSIELANRLICQDNGSGMFLTLWLGILDTRTGVGKYINAGHIPPVIRHADGSTELIENEPDLFLGNFPDMPPQVHHFTMKKGDVLLMYTDGISDAMDKDGRSFGYDNAAASVKKAESSAEAVALAVMRDARAFSSGTVRFDDMTLLALECVSLEEPETLVLDVPAEPAGTKAVIDSVDALLRRHDCPENSRRNIAVVADELCANIAEYAYGDEPGEIHLETVAGGNFIRLCFIDSGIEFDPTGQSDPLFTDEPMNGGLGIYFVKNLVDKLEYTRQDGKNILQATIIWNI